VRTGTLGPRVKYAFADRHDGVSVAPFDLGNLGDHVGDDPAAVASNRARLAGAVGVGSDRLAAMSPVHGADVVLVGPAPLATAPAADALVTITPGVALLVLAADCVPVLLADDAAGVVAVVHAGWRGVRSDVTGAALLRMSELGARPERTLAVIGPAICGRCYPVDRERFDAVVAVAPRAAAVAAGGGPALDLRPAVAERLEREGVGVCLVGGCTAESADWFSYRRDGVTGRHGGAVVLRGAP
jgi:hypothetical protein